MSIFDAMSEIETQTCQIMKARAVMQELEGHLESKVEPRTWQADQFVGQQEQMLLLLQVADGLLYAALPILYEVVDVLMQQHKDNKESESN